MDRPPGRHVVALVCALVGLAAPVTAQTEAGSVSGRVVLGVDDARMGALGPIVVYLEPKEAGATFPVPARKVVIEQKNAMFLPDFTVVVRGQSVEMPNRDAIYHNVFSYSRPNDFDLGTYPGGESRTVKLEHAGVVKTYCSIHETMNGTIFVSPTPYFARVDPGGSFLIGGVPPGAYQLRTWCEKLPPNSVDVSVRPGQKTRIEVPLLELAGE